MKKLILFLVIAAAVGFGVLNYHFIYFDDGLKIIRKTGVRYKNTFVDARGDKKLELALKPDLIAAGIVDAMNKVESK